MESGNLFAEAVINGLTETPQPEVNSIPIHYPWPSLISHRGIKSLTPPKIAPVSTRCSCTPPAEDSTASTSVDEKPTTRRVHNHEPPKSSTRDSQRTSSSSGSTSLSVCAPPLPQKQMSDIGHSRSSSQHVKVTAATTQRGKPAVILNNFMFVSRNTFNDRATWRCQSRKCKAVCTTNSLCELISAIPVHNHEPPKSFTPQIQMSDIGHSQSQTA